MRLATTALCLLLAGPAWAGDIAGTIKISRGSAYIERGTEQIPATAGDHVEVADSIVTGSDGTVGITLNDDTRLTAGPDSTLQLSRFAFDTTTHEGTIDASVKRGSLSVISGKIAKTSPQQVNFSTPSVTLGVRGTRFIIKAGQVED